MYRESIEIWYWYDAYLSLRESVLRTYYGVHTRTGWNKEWIFVTPYAYFNLGGLANYSVSVL